MLGTYAFSIFVEEFIVLLNCGTKSFDSARSGKMLSVPEKMEKEGLTSEDNVVICCFLIHSIL